MTHARRALLTALTEKTRWTWITGNHDPGFADHCGGEIVEEALVDGLVLRHELQEAAEMEITAVPTFVFDGKWMVPGAQDPETFVQVLRRVVAKRTADV